MTFGGANYPPFPHPIDRFWKRRQHPGPGLFGWMPLASMLLLAAGSLMLLPGPAVWMATGHTWAFSFSAVGVVFLFVGWAKLGLDISEVRGETRAYLILRRGLMWLAYGLSWIAFVIGMITLSGQISIPPPPPVTREILRGLFPYVPNIYVPVVLGQVAILLLGTDYLVHPRGRLISLIGVSTLLALSLTAIVLPLRGALGPGALFLAGSMGLGYLLVAMAWLVYSPARTTAPDRHIGIDRSPGEGYAIPGLARWWKWARRRNGWAALIPGILFLLGSYLLTQFQQCAAGVCTKPLATVGLGILGLGLFLIILGLVIFEAS